MAMVRNDVLIKFEASQEEYDTFKQKYIELDKVDTLEQFDFLYGDTLTQEKLNQSIENFAMLAKKSFEKEVKFLKGCIIFKKENLADFNYPLIIRALSSSDFTREKTTFIGVVSTNGFKGEYLDIWLTSQGVKLIPSKIKERDKMLALLESKEYKTLDDEVKDLLKKVKQRLEMR